MTTENILEGLTVKNILFTNVRDENNIKEWVAYHLLLGFDFIYIFDHKSQIPLKGQFLNFNKDKFQVYVSRCELEGAIKDTLITMAANIATKMNAEWMLYLDADEFLFINNDNIKDVDHMLSYYKHADSVSFNWLMFGSNFHKNNPNGFLIEDYTRSSEYLNDHLKTFFRPKEFESPNAHRSEVKNKLAIYHGNGRLLSKIFPPYKQNRHYINNIKFKDAQVFIAHYYYQCEEIYLKRKVNLPRDDWGVFREVNNNIHNDYNDVENTLVRDKHLERVKTYLRSIGEL